MEHMDLPDTVVLVLRFVCDSTVGSGSQRGPDPLGDSVRGGVPWGGAPGLDGLPEHH